MYTLQFAKQDTLAATLNSGATTTTLTTGNFGSPTGTQLYVVDYDVPAKAEIISATVATTGVTAITRGLTGGAAGTTDHAIGAKIGSIFVPQHYDRVANRTLGYAEITSAQASITTLTDVTGLTTTVTVPAGGARIKITAIVLFANSTTSGDGIIYLYEGATQLSLARVETIRTTVADTLITQVVISATAGIHTYNLKAQVDVGSGTVSASATSPAFILVENIE